MRVLMFETARVCMRRAAWAAYESADAVLHKEEDQCTVAVTDAVAHHPLAETTEPT